MAIRDVSTRTGTTLLVEGGWDEYRVVLPRYGRSASTTGATGVVVPE